LTIPAHTFLSAANLYGTALRHQLDHVLKIETLQLPQEAADATRNAGGIEHAAVRKFVDYEFPPCDTSIRGVAPSSSVLSLQGSAAASKTVPAWLPATIVTGQAAGPLFTPLRVPHGDWLAEVLPQHSGIFPILQAVHEYPGHMERLFASSPEVSALGNYSVSLFDAYQRKWEEVVVDEFVPTAKTAEGAVVPWSGGNNRALWALILEKALAKLCGSYDALNRSQPGPIIMALTGESEKILQWRRENGWWSQWGFQLPEPRKVVWREQLELRPDRPAPQAGPRLHSRVTAPRPLRFPLARVQGMWHQDIELFRTLRELHRGNGLLLAYTDVGTDLYGVSLHGDADPVGNGLVRGHGYSMLGLVEIEIGGAGLQGDETEQKIGSAVAGTTDGGGGHMLRLVQLRNAWGSQMKWQGPWSDGAYEWEIFPEVRRLHLRPEHQRAGRFWMAWTDFCEVFDRVEVCPMQAAARKASYVSRNLPRRRTGGSVRSHQALGGAWGLLSWRCCTVDRA